MVFINILRAHFLTMTIMARFEKVAKASFEKIYSLLKNRHGDYKMK